MFTFIIMDIFILMPEEMNHPLRPRAQAATQMQKAGGSVPVVSLRLERSFAGAPGLLLSNNLTFSSSLFCSHRCCEILQP